VALAIGMGQLAGGLAFAASSGKKLGHFRGVVTAGNGAGKALHGRLFGAAGANNMNYISWARGPLVTPRANG
jgi:hypothetical protein